MITSPDNPKLRYVRHLKHRTFRRREGRLAIEGVRLVEDALSAGVEPAFALIAPDTLVASPRGAALYEQLVHADWPVLATSDQRLADVSSTVTSQGVIAVIPAPKLRLPKDLDLALVVDGIRDPGNLGNLLRTALAAGVQAAFLAPGTVDPTNDKVVRSAMGAHFRLPIRYSDWAKIAERVEGMTLVVADVAGESAYDSLDWRSPSALVVGGEAEGPSEIARRYRTVRIPMAGGVESLNAATAAAVIFFEAQRQRTADRGASGS